MLCTFFWKTLAITSGETTYFIIVKDGIKVGVAWLKANCKFYLQNVPVEKKKIWKRFRKELLHWMDLH